MESMTGRAVNVSVNVTNDFRDDVTIYDIIITKTPEPYETLAVRSDILTLVILAARMLPMPILIGLADAQYFKWNASGGTLNQNETRQIFFNATARQI